MKADLKRRLERLERVDVDPEVVRIRWADEITPEEEAQIIGKGGQVIRLKWLDDYQGLFHEGN